MTYRQRRFAPPVCWLFLCPVALLAAEEQASGRGACLLQRVAGLDVSITGSLDGGVSESEEVSQIYPPLTTDDEDYIKDDQPDAPKPAKKMPKEQVPWVPHDLTPTVTEPPPSQRTTQPAPLTNDVKRTRPWGDGVAEKPRDSGPEKGIYFPSKLVELHLAVSIKEIHNGKCGPVHRFLQTVQKLLGGAGKLTADKLQILGIRGDFVNLTLAQVGDSSVVEAAVKKAIDNRMALLERHGDVGPGVLDGTIVDIEVVGADSQAVMSTWKRQLEGGALLEEVQEKCGEAFGKAKLLTAKESEQGYDMRRAMADAEKQREKQ